MDECTNESGRPRWEPRPAAGLAFDARGVLGPVNPDPWERLMMLANEYAAHLVDATHPAAESRADIARTAALKTLGKMREVFFAHCKEVEQGTRHACSIAVWMTLQDALAPDADDKGLDGWMREAEQRVKLGPNMGLTGDHRMLRAICRHLGYLDPIRAVVYEGIADEQLLELVAAALESGDVSRSLVAALADGRVTQREFESFDEKTVSVAENSKIEWTDRVCELEDELAAVRAEIEAMTALAELRDRLRGMVVEDPVRLRKV